MNILNSGQCSLSLILTSDSLFHLLPVPVGLIGTAFVMQSARSESPYQNFKALDGIESLFHGN